MSLHIEPLSTLPQLRGLLEVTRLVRDERDLARLVERIAETISTSLGWGTVAINLYRPASGDFEVAAVHGSEGARKALLGTTRPADAWAPVLAERFLRRGAYLIPSHEADWAGLASHVPEVSVSSEANAWHAEDALIVPMRGADGTLLAVVSVDEPWSGVQPTDEELDVLVAFAEHVMAAIEGVQLAAVAARDRASLRRLLEVSASLVDLDTVDSVLETVARGIRDALEFEKVAVCLARDGGFRPVGTAGWGPGDPGLDFAISRDDLDLLFVPEFELEGCYLIGRETAEALVGDSSNYRSRRGGSGPRAWSRHWLLVPLVERDGALRGFLWVDDPVDSLLPSRNRLQALRTFANQATMALRSASAFAKVNRHNRELAALHETTIALLDRHDLDSTLSAIVDSARQLVDSPHAYVYLSDGPDSTLQMRVGHGLFETFVGKVVLPGHGISGAVFVSGETLVVDDYAVWPDRHADYAGPELHAMVGVPLRAGGDLVGMIGLAREEPGRVFAPAEVELLERFAHLASLALQNARLYAALRQSEELHRRIVDCSTDLIGLVDLDGTIVVISPSVFGTLGIQPQELVGTHFAQLVHPDDLAAAEETFSKAVEGLSATMTVRARHADGSWVRLESVASVVVGPDGKPQHILATGRDVTERQRLQEQLQQAQKMESIGRLAGGIAHDFNNLLTAIGGYAELMLMDFDAGATPARDSAEQIARAAGRAASLTGQLLAFSRKQMLRPQVIDLNEVVGGMATMLARMLGDDVVLSTAFDAELGPTLADPTQVEQVVLNLALNARDAMPNGGSLVVGTAPLELAEDDVRPHPDLEPGSYVTLAVRDTGIGIEPHLIEKIFEPFFTTKGVGEGTGLGLATVHGIVSQSGGVIWVKSTPGEGTTFTVCLPLAAEREQGAGSEQQHA